MSSPEATRSGVQHAEQWREVTQAFGDQMLDAIDAHPLAVDGHPPRAERFATLALGQVAPDQDVDDAAFIKDAERKQKNASELAGASSWPAINQLPLDCCSCKP